MNVRQLAIALSFVAFLAPVGVSAAETSSDRVVEKTDAAGSNQAGSNQAGSNQTESDQAAIDRMTTHLMAMMPIDRIFQQVIESHRASLKSELDARQYDCMMRELGKEALIARKRIDVVAFAQANPQAFDSGMKVLDAGAASLIAKIMESTFTGENYDVNQAPPDAMVAFVSFAFGSEYAELRELSGFGDFSDSGASGRAIETMMNALAADLSKTCAIPAEFFE